jgi:ribonuclease D
LGRPGLTEAQVAYAASDVLYLHQLRTALDERI